MVRFASLDNETNYMLSKYEDMDALKLRRCKKVNDVNIN